MCHCALLFTLLCAAQEIVDALHSERNASILELKGNTLGVSAAKAIGSALEHHSHIKVITTFLYVKKLNSIKSEVELHPVIFAAQNS